MAARLLDLLGAHQGIARSLDDYVAGAVRLATDRSACAKFKAHFTADSWFGSIGNIAFFTSEYEATLQRICLSPARE